MILVDTNVISEFMTSAPTAQVLSWLNAQVPGTLYLPAIAVAEIHYGLNFLPAGKRRNFLRERFEIFLAQAFAGRVLAFDQDAAKLYGEIAGKRRNKGLPISTLDAQIAAIARLHGFTLATRNTKDFKDCDIALVNPFLA